MTDVVLTDPAAETEQRFLESLRRRVAWQSERAAELRAEAGSAQAEVDLLDPQYLAALIETHPQDSRAAERRAFLAELRDLVEADGRLPEALRRLMRFVFSDLL